MHCPKLCFCHISESWMNECFYFSCNNQYKILILCSSQIKIEQKKWTLIDMLAQNIYQLLEKRIDVFKQHLFVCMVFLCILCVLASFCLSCKNICLQYSEVFQAVFDREWVCAVVGVCWRFVSHWKMLPGFQTCGGVNICHLGTNIHQSSVLQIIYDGWGSFFFLCLHIIFVLLSLCLIYYDMNVFRSLLKVFVSVH